MTVPRLDASVANEAEVDFSELLEMRIAGAQHAHHRAAVVVEHVKRPDDHAGYPRRGSAGRGHVCPPARLYSAICSAQSAAADSPQPNRRYQSTVRAIAVSNGHRGDQPSRVSAFSILRLSSVASCLAAGAGAVIQDPDPNSAMIRLTTSSTERALVRAGPKFHACRGSASPPRSAAPSVRYPDSGSSTCCHGRVECG